MQLPQLPADKANHLIYGAALFVAAAALAGLAGHAWPRVVGVAVVAAAAIGKEAADHLRNRTSEASSPGGAPPHGVEWRDAAATVAGALLVWAGSLSIGG